MVNPKLRSFLIFVGALTLIVISVVLIPRGVSLYYQTRGGQLIDWVLHSSENISELSLGCEPLPVKKVAAIEKVEKAKNYLDIALRFNTNNSQTFYHLGQAYCLKGDPEKARLYYEDYINRRPDNPLGYIGLGFAMEKIGDLGSAKRAWDSAGLTSHDFNSVGDEEFKAERFMQAIQWYERSILVEPRSAETWLMLGTVYEQISEKERALEAYSQAWEIDPEISTSNLVDAFKSLGDLKSVENTLQQMLDQYPDSVNRLIWYQELGSSYTSHGDYEQAVELYAWAIEEFPEQPDLHISLGWAYYEGSGDFETAREEFEQVIILDGENGEGYYSLARLLSSEGLFKEADEYFSKSLELVPRNRWYMLSKANNLLSAGNLEMAIEYYKDIIVLYPDFGQAYFQLSLAYQLNNQFQEAINAIEKTLNLVEPSARYLVRAGDIYRLAGNQAKAISFYNRALKLNPNNQQAAKGLNLISEQ